MKFIEMSRFKVLLTGCVLLLMLNCYQLYGSDFLVSYDPQKGTVKTEKRPLSSGTTISVELSGIPTWEAAVQIFKETRKIIEEKTGRSSPSYLHFFYNSAPVDLYSSPKFLDSIVIEENPPQKIKAILCLGGLQQSSNQNSRRCCDYAIELAKATGDRSIEADTLLELGKFVSTPRQTSRC